MKVSWEETILVFEQFKDTNNASKCKLSISGQVRSELQNYISHSSIYYQVGNDIYVVSEVKFKRESQPIVHCEPTPAMSAALEKAGLQMFGAMPTLSKNTPRVVCMIYDDRQLEPNYQRKREGELWGKMILMLNDNPYEFKRIEFTMGRVLCGLYDEYHLSPLPKSPALHSSLGSFRQFQQEGSAQFAASGIDVADLILLRLLKPKSSDALSDLSTIKIRGSRVELHELIGIPVRSEVEDGFGCFEWFLRKKTLHSKHYRKGVALGRKDASFRNSYWRVPKALYTCKLPAVGPTIHTSDFSRHYGVLIVLDVEWGKGLHKEELKAYQDISVVQHYYNSFYRHMLPESPSAWQSSKTYSLTSIELKPKKKFVPHEVARSNLRKISSNSELTYCSHRTDSWEVGENIYSVARSIVRWPKLPLAKNDTKFVRELEKRGMSVFGGTPRFEYHEMYIMCEVVMSSEMIAGSSDKDLVGGLFLNTDKGKLEIPSPFAFAPVFLGCQRDINTTYFVGKLWGDVFWASLDVKFKRQRQFKACAGSNIVLPGTRFSEFLDVDLNLPQKASLEIDGPTTIVVTGKSIFIIEIVQSNRCQARGFQRTEVELISVKNMREDTSHKKFVSRVTGERMLIRLPTLIYECHVPYFGPTFVSNDLNRDYQIRIEIGLLISGMRIKLQRTVRLNIASPPRESLIDRSAPSRESLIDCSPPPPYEK